MNCWLCLLLLAQQDVSEHLTLGNPTQATAGSDVNLHNALLVKPEFALAYDATAGSPRWVSWRLGKNWLGFVDRGDGFRADHALPSGWARIVPTVYDGTGFDRGHLCPSADRTRSEADNAATFVMTNIIPQSPKLNRQPWRELEMYCRGRVAAGDELFIVAGPSGNGGRGSEGRRLRIGTGNESVAVPAACWKIVLAIPDKLGNDIDRIDGAAEAFAVWMPNSQTTDGDWKIYRTTIRHVERRVGIDFGNLLPRAIQDALETREP